MSICRLAYRSEAAEHQLAVQKLTQKVHVRDFCCREDAHAEVVAGVGKFRIKTICAAQVICMYSWMFM